MAGAAGTTLVIHGLDECLRALNGLQSDLRREANGELRQASKQIAAGVIPMLGGSGAPQEPALLASLGPRSDRLVTVAVVRKPRLSGLRRTPAAIAKGAIFWPVEIGSDYPPFHGPPTGGIVANHREALARYAIPRYTEALAKILRKWDLV
jgi:hypothetical protein